jgi:hypothetical protein
MNTPDADSRDFVVGFADPLARLAYLLVAGAPDTSSDDLTIDALARVRRRWHEAEATGTPEPLAVEALLDALPHRRHLPVPGHRDPAPERLKAASPVTPSADDADSAFRRPSAASSHDGADGQVAVAIDLALVHDAVWDAWKTLAPRQRVPLVFADPSIASRRLAGLGLPESTGSVRHQHAMADSAWHDLRLALLSDRATAGWVESAGEDGLAAVLAETLSEHASTAAPPIDPYPLVVDHVRHARRRTAVAVTVVVALLAAGTATAVQVSNSSTSNKAAAAAASASAASAAASFHAAPAPRDAAGAAQLDASIVIDWPTRGNAASDGALIENLRNDFVKAHPTAVGQVQVLVAADTPAFRVAYVTANSKFGVMQAWYYGPVGATRLIEGSFSFGGRLVAGATVLATALADPAGHTELVVIAPPSAAQMELEETDFSKPPGPGFQSLPSTNGVAIKDVSGSYVPSLILRLRAGTLAVLIDHIDTQQLVGSSPTTPQRGKANPDLLVAALANADDWRRTGALAAPSGTVVLWGGTDARGTDVVVLRLKTLHLSDLLVVVWSGPPLNEGKRSSQGDGVPPHQGVAYRLPPDVADFPLVFGYGNGQVGVVVPSGVAKTSLVVDGEEGPQVPVDANGFASMTVTGQTGLLSEQTLQIDLYDASGHVVRTLPMPTAD